MKLSEAGCYRLQVQFLSSLLSFTLLLPTLENCWQLLH